MAAEIGQKQFDHWTVKDLSQYSWLLGHPVIAGEYVCFVRQKSGAEIPADAIAGYMIF